MNTTLLKKLASKLSIPSMIILALTAVIVEQQMFSISVVDDNAHSLLLILTIASLIFAIESHQCLKREIRVMRFEQRVSSLYEQLLADEKKVVDNPYTIKEISYLMDVNKKLKLNSFLSGRLQEIHSRIKTPLNQ